MLPLRDELAADGDDDHEWNQPNRVEAAALAGGIGAHLVLAAALATASWESVVMDNILGLLFLLCVGGPVIYEIVREKIRENAAEDTSESMDETPCPVHEDQDLE